MPFQKKELKEVKEQPGSKQKELPKDKKPEQKKSKEEPKEKSKGFEDKSSKSEAPKKDSKPRLKNEMAGQHETGLDHPAAQYESYKRPRKDS